MTDEIKMMNREQLRKEIVTYAVEHKLHKAYRNEEAFDRYQIVTHCVEITDEFLKSGIEYCINGWESEDENGMSPAIRLHKGDFIVFTNTPMILTEYYALDMIDTYYLPREEFLATHTELYRVA